MFSAKIYAWIIALILLTLVPNLTWAAGGTVYLYGQSPATVTNTPPGLTNVIAVSGGLDHAVALREDGTVVSWGPDLYATNTPVGLSNVIDVKAGWLFSMALRKDARVVTWGAVDPPPPDLTNAVAIAAGGHQFCLALRADHTVTAWGYNGSGQTNVPASLTNAIAIAAGMDHCLALRDDGTVTGWGTNNSGELDIPTGLTNVVAISAGPSQSFALCSDGTPFAWGFLTGIPPGLSNVVAIAGGWNATELFLRRDGTVDYAYPGLSNAVAVSRGHFFVVAITAPSPAFLLAKPMTNLSWKDGKFSATTTSRPGKVYSLEFKNNLSENWTARPLVSGRENTLTVEDPDASPPKRFYRLLEW